MGERPLTPLGLAMLGQLPPVLRGSSDYQAAIHAHAREIELLETAVALVRTQLNPAAADVLLPAWEATVRLPVGGGGAGMMRRQQNVLARLRRLLSSGEGRAWEQRVTDIVGPGWTYQEHVPGDATTPPANTIHVVLPFPAGLSRSAAALDAIREVTAAHLALTFGTTSGFVLDVSELDAESFGP